MLGLVVGACLRCERGSRRVAEVPICSVVVFFPTRSLYDSLRLTMCRAKLTGWPSQRSSDDESVIVGEVDSVDS